jgi:hypothetical protein
VEIKGYLEHAGGAPLAGLMVLATAPLPLGSDDAAFILGEVISLNGDFGTLPFLSLITSFVIEVVRRDDLKAVLGEELRIPVVVASEDPGCRIDYDNREGAGLRPDVPR